MTETKDEISISRAKLESITVYDVMEEELEIIERGSPSSTFLNFAIALLSIFLSLLTTLFVTKIDDNRVFQGFITVCAITGIAGIVLLVLWIRTNNDTKTIFQKIRARKSAAIIREVAQEIVTDSIPSEESFGATGPKG